MELEPTLAAYECPTVWPNPDPPLVWCEQYRPISRIEGMDASDRDFQWSVSSSAGEPWDGNEVGQMWLQLLQLYRLPQTLCLDGDRAWQAG